MRLFPALAPLVLLALPAGAQEPLQSTTSAQLPLVTPPTEWLGPEPHLVMMGSVDGHVFDVQLTEIGAEADVAAFSAERGYVPEGDGHRYLDFEVSLQAVLNGIEKRIELEFQNHDFSAFDKVTELALQSEDYPEGAQSTFDLSFQWEDGGASVNEEIADWDGTMTLHLDEGDTGDRGLSGTGMIGGLVNARRGQDSMIISFTAPVRGYEIED